MTTHLINDATNRPDSGPDATTHDRATKGADIISFAGSAPAANALDLSGLRRAVELFASESFSPLSQIDMTEGYAPLRELVAQRMTRRGIRTVGDQVLITSGSQQALDIVNRVLVRPGDRVVVEAPCHPGTLGALHLLGAQVIVVPVDREGIVLDALERALAQHQPKLVHLMPNFANPTGMLTSLRRRKKVLEIVRMYGCYVAENDSYGELFFEDLPPPSLLALANAAEREWVIYVSSFSNTLAPGLRLGWLSTPGSLMSRARQYKQITDIHSSGVSQHIAFHYLNSGALEPALQRARRVYLERASIMSEALRAELGGVMLHTPPPEGGLFCWGEFPGLDTTALLAGALRRGVIYDAGEQFYDGVQRQTGMRLSFANVRKEAIVEGVSRLATAIREVTASGSPQLSGM
jgi:DNA-binding transcriptional MocR family regulator